MQIKKKNINNLLIIFLSSHLIIWTLIPYITNDNLPLDVIEAIVWSDGWPLGWAKHPPLSSWFPGIFFQVFGNQDWSYYLLSQLFVVASFIVVWKFSQDFFENKSLSFISILILEGIYFYNFTSPEFNVNVCQLPFWALTVYYAWKSYKEKAISNWILFGTFAALGFLSKYLFIYLLIGIIIFFIFIIIKEKKYYFKYLIPGLVFIIILTPHIIWLVENNFITIIYALNRTTAESSIFLNHLLNPLIFLGKQIGILIPFFILFFLMISKFKPKINLKDKKLIFLLAVNIAPLILIFLTSMIMGAKIRTMWMTPFYLFIGVFLIYLFQNKINLNKLKYFFTLFFILFIFSPIAYSYVSITQNNKRTDYPGKKIAKKVQEKWEANFKNKIGVVGGDHWHGGNLFYNLESKPKWDNIFESKKNPSIKNEEDGFVLIGDADILSNICKGVFFKVEKQGICMIGVKK